MIDQKVGRVIFPLAFRPTDPKSGDIFYQKLDKKVGGKQNTNSLAAFVQFQFECNPWSFHKVNHSGFRSKVLHFTIGNVAKHLALLGDLGGTMGHHGALNFDDMANAWFRKLKFGFMRIQPVLFGSATKPRRVSFFPTPRHKNCADRHSCNVRTKMDKLKELEAKPIKVVKKLDIF